VGDRADGVQDARVHVGAPCRVRWRAGLNPGSTCGVFELFVYGRRQWSGTVRPIPLFDMVLRLRTIVYKRKGSSNIYYSCGSREVGLCGKE
jgi:hypothetical protein